MRPVVDARLLQQELWPLLIILCGQSSSWQLLLVRTAGESLVLAPLEMSTCL